MRMKGDIYISFPMLRVTDGHSFTCAVCGGEDAELQATGTDSGHALALHEACARLIDGAMVTKPGKAQPVDIAGQIGNRLGKENYKMAETTVLRSTASARQVSAVNNSATAHAQVTGPLPMVTVTMGSGGKPKIDDGTPRNVHVMPMRGQQGQVTRQAGGRPQIAAPVAPVIAAPAFSQEHLLLFRHLVSQFIGQGADEVGVENANLATEALDALDLELAASSEAQAQARPAPNGNGQGMPRRVVVSSQRGQAISGISPRQVARKPAPVAASSTKVTAPIEDVGNVIDVGDVADAPDAGSGG